MANLKISLSGPVTDELCVSRHVLGPVVLRTALNYSKMLKEEKSKPYPWKFFIFLIFFLTFEIYFTKEFHRRNY